MQSSSHVEIADQASRRRAIIVAVAAGMFLLIQFMFGPFFSGEPETMSIARHSVWAINVVLLMLVLLTGGGLAQKAEIRALVNDEVSRSNSRSAVVFGFWIAMIVAMLIYAFAGDSTLTVRGTVYLIVTPSVSMALLVFSWLELRAHRDG
jgi:hypothetical protein